MRKAFIDRGVIHKQTERSVIRNGGREEDNNSKKRKMNNLEKPLRRKEKKFPTCLGMLFIVLACLWRPNFVAQILYYVITSLIYTTPPL